MLGLTTLGIIHTAISLVAVACGFWALARDKEISAHNRLGRAYLVTTLLTAVTGLGFFQHGGFGPPHVLSILTILALAIGTAAGYTETFGHWSRHVQVVSFSVTVLFHMIPGFTETLTRLPLGQPLFPNAEAPGLRPIYATLFVLFGIGLFFQLRRLRKVAGKPLASALA